MMMKARLREWKKTHLAGVDQERYFENIRTESRLQNKEKERALVLEKSSLKIPDIFRGKNFSDYSATTAEQVQKKFICERFVETFDDRVAEGSVVKFLGSPGTGKTFLSLIMYQQIVKLGYSVHYEPTLDFLTKLQQTRFKSVDDYQLRIQFYQQIDFLILDEVTEAVNQTGRPSACDLRILFEVINSRYVTGKRCTLLISNHDQKTVASRLGQPIADRLSQNSLTLIFNWPSYRSTN
jgi:DNA replication protein DnaC